MGLGWSSRIWAKRRSLEEPRAPFSVAKEQGFLKFLETIAAILPHENHNTT